MLRAVILLGGPSKSGSFGPFDLPSPFFQLAGIETIIHQIHALSGLKTLKDIFFLGFYEPNVIQPYIQRIQQLINYPIQYLGERQEMGTAGGIAFYIDSIFSEEIEDVIVLHSDICTNLPLEEFLAFHHQKACSVMTMKVSQEESSKYGCFVKNAITHELIHHAEKPEHFVSDLINCGVYLFSSKYKQVFQSTLEKRSESIEQQLEKQPILQFIKKPQELNKDYLSIEQDIIDGRKGVFLFEINPSQHFWLPVKNLADLIQANQLYLKFYSEYPAIYEKHREYKLLSNFVLVHENARISPTAKLGPYVVIGAGCKIGDGVRIVNSIVLDGVEVKNYCHISNAIIGHNSTIGYWCRVEGSTGNDTGGRITVLGCRVRVDNELNLRNSIVLSNKKISSSCHDEYII